MAESGKQGSSSDISSDEQADHLYDQVKEDADSLAKRSYGCVFCKRGFTNAQALGGHMNIHRKDRANAKQITVSSLSSTPSKHIDQSIITNSPCFEHVSPEHDKCYASVFELPQLSYQASGCSPTNPHRHYQEIGDWFVPRSTKSLSGNEELWGSDLSLQIRPNDELGRRRVWNNDQVLDLELRLGYNP